MSREVQVRFCERRGVRLPPPTLPVVHCATERQAKEVLAALGKRMAEVGLQLHPDKTRIVYCIVNMSVECGQEGWRSTDCGAV